MTGAGGKLLYFFIPVLFFHMTYEFIPFYSNAALKVSVICDASLI